MIYAAAAINSRKPFTCSGHLRRRTIRPDEVMDIKTWPPQIAGGGYTPDYQDLAIQHGYQGQSKGLDEVHLASSQ